MKKKFIFKLLTISIILTFLAGCSSKSKNAPEEAVEPLKVKIQTEKEEEDKNYKWSVDHITVEGDYPVSTIDVVNDTLEAYLQEKISLYDYVKNPEENEVREYPNEFFGQAEVMTNASNIFSVAFNMYQYSGSAHGSNWTKHYTFDLVQGKETILSDFFKEDFDYLEIIYQDLLKQTKDNILLYESLTNDYYKDKVSLEYYVYDNKIFIYFSTYSLGSYADGEQVFSILYETVEDHLSPLGLRVYGK